MLCCSLLRRSVPFALVGAAMLGLIAWIPARSQDKQDKGEHGRPERGQEKDSPLEGDMNTMKAELRALGKGINAESRDKALERIANFQKAVLAAKLETPPTAAEVPADKKAEYVAGFRRKLIEVLATSCKLETAVIDGKYDDATKIVTNDLKQLQNEGHDKYKGKDKDEH
jgi:hypothetical protein